MSDTLFTAKIKAVWQQLVAAGLIEHPNPDRDHDTLMVQLALVVELQTFREHLDDHYDRIRQ